MDIIETAKKSLRITHNNFDEEIVDMTDAALEDLRAAGIEATITGSALGRLLYFIANGCMTLWEKAKNIGRHMSGSEIQ